MWLDADFEGGRGRNSRGKTLPTVIREAEAMLASVSEGQVGVFTSYGYGQLLGYVIKTPEKGTFFEPAIVDDEPCELATALNEFHNS